MADFSNTKTRSGNLSTNNTDFHKVKVPPLKEQKKSKFWKLAMEIANEYKGKINPKTKRAYTREERLHIGMATAGRVASRQKIRKSKGTKQFF